MNSGLVLIARAFIASLIFSISVFASPSMKEEVKLLVWESQIDQALRVLDVRPRDAEKRGIYFFDTARIALFQSGVILRGRTSPDDSTVKLRPVDPSTIPSKYRELKGFKCEIDRTASKAVTACSLTLPKKLKRKPKKVFSDLQEAFASLGLGGRTLPWDRIRPFGPIDAFEWEINGGARIGWFELELWELPSGKRFLEASLRVPKGEGPRFQSQIAHFFEERGIRMRASGTSKTLEALSELR